MTKSTSDYSAIDIHEVLKQRRQVAVIWGIEDVQEMRPDLDANQSWQVLQQCRRRHDCSTGFTWEWIDAVAESMFPE